MACLFHRWNGCKCDKCGKIRDEQHDWDLCKGICNRCGKRQAIKHDWKRCKCSRCGIVIHHWDSDDKLLKTADERHHSVKLQRNICKCTICGEIRDDYHDWDKLKGICKLCSKECSHRWKTEKKTNTTN